MTCSSLGIGAGIGAGVGGAFMTGLGAAGGALAVLAFPTTVGLVPMATVIAIGAIAGAVNGAVAGAYLGGRIAYTEKWPGKGDALFAYILHKGTAWSVAMPLAAALAGSLLSAAAVSALAVGSQIVLMSSVLLLATALVVAAVVSLVICAVSHIRTSLPAV